MEKQRLADRVKDLEKDENIEEKEKQGKQTTIGQIISKSTKDKQISAKVNQKTYDAFTSINKLQGLSNNSALNMLISKYVRENKEILED